MVAATEDKRRLVTGNTPPDMAYPYIPPQQAFKSDFIEAPDLVEIVHALIAHHETRFDHLGTMVIRVVWKKKGGGSGGASTLGKCVRTSGLVKHYGECDFVIWVAADHTRENAFTCWQMEALLFHELLHCDVDDDGAAATKAHDLECFTDEVCEYGAWKRDLLNAARVFGQLTLDLPDGRKVTTDGEIIDVRDAMAATR